MRDQPNPQLHSRHLIDKLPFGYSSSFLVTGFAATGFT
jgi:hypothetical protein